MNRNEDLKSCVEKISQLAQELRETPKNDNNVVVLARLVRGLSIDNWDEIAHTELLEDWRIFPLKQADAVFLDNSADFSDYSFHISPFREVGGALTPGMFTNLLKRELLRLNRNGGCLSLLGVALVGKKRLATALGTKTVDRIEEILGAVLLGHIDDCDSLGVLKAGQYVCCFPGIGQLAARSLAEKYQNDFADAVRPFLPTGGISAGQMAECAIGIVNVLQGDRPRVNDLLTRAKTTLELALNKENGYIYQESSLSPIDNPTLVQSNEKRFLFFGGE